MRVLGVAIREEPWIFTLAVVGSAVYGFTTVASATVLGRVTDRVVLPAFHDGRIGYGALVAGIAAILGVAALKVFGIVGRRVWAGIMQYRLQATYRRRLTRQYLRLPLSWHHRHPTGQLLSNANADVESAWMPIAPLPMAVGVVVMLLTSVVSMLLTDLVLSIVGLLVFPLIALLNVVYQRRLAPLAARAQQLRAEVSEIAHESFDGALVVKTLGREDEETARFAVRADDLRDANVAVGRVRGLFDPVLEALPTIGVLAVLVVGSARVASGALPAGDLVQVAYLFTLLAFPIRALGWVLGDLSRAVVGWTRMRSVLDAAGAAAHGDTELTGTDAATVRMSGVGFSYSGLPGTDVLHDVDLAVPPGRTIAVVGPTGAGKSTLAQLMVRLVDPTSGTVALDDVDARELASGELPRAAALVPQQTYLFDDTVRGNVALGLDVSDDDVWAALRVAQAERFVRALPDGLETRVGERGATLSGGQRQRIALARAIVRRPRLLVLDDATSAVDPRVEARILAGLRDSTEGRRPVSVVVVAYRKATIALADEVAYVERGRVAATGAHADLLAREPGYRELVTAYERETDGDDPVRTTGTPGPGDEEAVA
jgi:ABC-type multidrug transport system fused ATPase/permease subunit